jgi:uncharacterized protein YkwD
MRPSCAEITFFFNQTVLLMLILTSFSICSLSCNAPHSAGHPDGPLLYRPKPQVDASVLERRIHTLINKERDKHGLSLLAGNDTLSRIARGHSKDMGSRRYFSHDSPEGHDFSFRYQQGGYTCALRVGNTVHMGAENIYQNIRFNSVATMNGEAYYDWNSEEQIAETTVRGWMDSPGHRKNILTPHWRSEGIGVFLSPDEKVYITQNFC